MSFRCSDEVSLPDSAHVEVGDFNDFGETEDAGVADGLQLFIRNEHQRLHKLHNGITIQLLTAPTQFTNTRIILCEGYIAQRITSKVYRFVYTRVTVVDFQKADTWYQALWLVGSNEFVTLLKAAISGSLHCEKVWLPHPTPYKQNNCYALTGLPLDKDSIQFLSINLLNYIIRWGCFSCFVLASFPTPRIMQWDFTHWVEVVCCFPIQSTCMTTYISPDNPDIAWMILNTRRPHQIRDSRPYKSARRAMGCHGLQQKDPGSFLMVGSQKRSGTIHEHQM